MQFNTYLFVLLFLPAVVAGYFLCHRLSRTLGHLFLLAASLVFYSFAGARCALVLALSVLVNYSVSLLLRRTAGRGRKTLLTLGILFNAGLLFYFKYFNFFLTNVNALFSTELPLTKLFLPLGISFFTFQQISYLLDTARDESDRYTLLEYGLYILYFPKLIMGPLVEPEEFIPQLRRPEIGCPDFDRLVLGLRMFSLGLVKKVILADTFAKAVNWGFGNTAALSSADVFLVMLAYTFQIYFDFSGYSDMAIGMSKMLNLELPVNFDSPYKALSISEFWKGWHMTLTRFFTRHIYIPLGGSRKGALRTYVNVMIVFFISGVWHGANWTFILWGVLHGAFLVLHKMFRTRYDKLHPAFRWMLTFAIVNVLWLLFRAESVTQWADFLKNLVSFSDTSISADLMRVFCLPELEALFTLPVLSTLAAHITGFAMLLFFGGAVCLCLVCDNTQRRSYPNTWLSILFQVLILIWCLVSLSGESTFVYFGF